VSGMRNVSRGLASRTKIIELIEKGKNNIPEISEKAGLSQSVVGHHLKLLLKQRVVAVAQSGRAGRWTLTKYGQEKLFSSS
jgi:predicted transcriptional regulator